MTARVILFESGSKDIIPSSSIICSGIFAIADTTSRFSALILTTKLEFFASSSILTAIPDVP